MKGLYKIFSYTEKQKNEIEYLTEITILLKIEDKVDDALFQFSPNLTDKNDINDHQSWAIFHKSILMNEIIYKLLEEIIQYDYDLEDAINEQIYNEKYIDFLLKNDLRGLSKKQIIKKFKNFFDNIEEL